jgi:outer membrane receptor protein involved in Fe transport
MTRKIAYITLGVVLVAALAFPQAGTGRLEGVVKDAQGLVLPGATVTLTGAAVMGQRTATTDVDGSYRFLALPPSTYNLSFELAGFQTFRREGIIITSGSTFTIDANLQIATVAETITVTGESPVVDVKTTGVSATFDTTELHDVPSATDMWAVLQQTPGIRMQGFDVGGSHKSQQTGYDAFGISVQNRVVNEGVNTTEGAGWAGGYYDYYAIEEFRVSAQGADVEMSSPGAHVVSVFKSGSNELSSLTHFDFETEGMVTDNIDADLEARNGTSAPVRVFREFHIDAGGPVVKDKFWFYGAYNYFKIDKTISGQDPSIATDIGLFDEITGKINWQISEKDQFIGFSHWSLKQKPYRGLSLQIPAESIRAQNSWTWLHKAEWQRVWSDRLFSNILVGHFGFGWPMTPAVDPDTNPPRIDLTTGQQRGAGWQPFTLDRWKPQSTGQFNYYVPSAAGSHDFKFGWDWQIDSYGFGANENSGPLRYRDRSSLGPCSPCATGQLGRVDEINFYNVPTANDDRNKHWDFYAQDIWAPNDRLTVTLGVRYGRQEMYYVGSTQTPILTEFFAPVTIDGETVQVFNTLAPRLGVTVDLTGEGKTVLKGYFGRYYSNAANMSSGLNPGGNSFVRYKFLDPNGNGLYDGQQELGAFVTAGGGGAGNTLDPNFEPMYADEFSFSVEHELVADTGLRFSYVRKQLRNSWIGSNTPYYPVNLARATPNLTNNVDLPCNGCPSGFEGTTLHLRGLPDGVPVDDLRIANAPGDTDGNFDTIQFAFNRRFSQAFFANATFDYQWRHEMRGADLNWVSESPLDTDPIFPGRWYPEYNRDISQIQETTYWTFKSAARYEAGAGLGLAGTVRIQSGFPWAAIHQEDLPNVGTVAFLLEDIKNNRSETVPIVDFRIDKAFNFGDKYTFTAMADIYNLFNTNAETNFVLRTGGDYRSIIEWIGGRTLKIGLRFQF